jgi:NTE family protein
LAGGPRPGRLGRWIEPNNLRLLFAAGGFAGDLAEDLREDFSFVRVLARQLLRGADAPPGLDPAAVFAPLRPQPLPALRRKRIGIVASGGSGATASLIGVKRAFEEAGLEVAALSACSGSMLFASLWACGLSSDEMAEFWLTLRSRDYVDPDWLELARAGLRRFRDFGGILRGEAVERSFRRRLGAMSLGRTPVPLHAVAWNVDRNRIEYLGSRTTPRLAVARAVRTAISIPLFVEPVRIGRHLYGDGGVVSIFPVRPLVDLEEPFDLVLGINCYCPPHFLGEDIGNWRRQDWAILRASGQLRWCVYLELARENARLLGDRLTLIHPVPYAEVRGARFYESFLDRRGWPGFMRAGQRAARSALRRMAEAAAGPTA